MKLFKKRLQRLEERFVVPAEPGEERDEEFEMICRQDPEAMVLHAQANAIIHEAMKDHPDAGALYADQARLYAAMDTPALMRLRDCVQALHDRVDLLRKNPRPLPAKDEYRSDANRNARAEMLRDASTRGNQTGRGRCP